MNSPELYKGYQEWNDYEMKRGHYADEVREGAQYSHEAYKTHQVYLGIIKEATRKFFEEHPHEYIEIPTMINEVKKILGFSADESDGPEIGDIVMAMHYLYSDGILRWTGDRRIYLNLDK